MGSDSSNAPIAEALRRQMEVQRKLQDQLEVGHRYEVIFAILPRMMKYLNYS
jgi:hypothetical protein